MNCRIFAYAAGGLLLGSWLLGLCFTGQGIRRADSRAVADEAAPSQAAEITELRSEVDRLKASLALTSAMRDVDYHAQNLWFAGRAGNWPLANYYWRATQSHMRLASELRNLDGTKGDVDFAAIRQSIENSPSMQVGKAIESRDVILFQTHYRGLLEGCYACHKAAGRPFLRPRMPVKPHQGMITVDPNATWPQ